MWPLLRSNPTADDRDRFVIAPHHPDRLGRPQALPGRVEDERFHQALTWNVFRTLELLAPAFWLRRVHLKLTGHALEAVPQTVRVSLWRALPMPPIQRIDGARPEVVADVVIETEHTVWTLGVAAGREPWGDDGCGESVARLVDAGAWLAGARDHHSGLIDAVDVAMSIGRSLRGRYAWSRESAELRSRMRPPVRARLSSFGALAWTDLAAILRECQHASGLSSIEQALAGNAVQWLRGVGVDAAGD
jgi:hypothetical protein